MLERHHIVYRSQGGLDFEMNYKYLDSNSHRGINGPHRNKETDLIEIKKRISCIRENYKRN